MSNWQVLGDVHASVFSLGCVESVLLLLSPCGLATAEDTPPKYVLEYTKAEAFCPPTEGFFEEVQRTVDRVGTDTFRHQPNGGYGLPVVDKVGDANLIHLVRMLVSTVSANPCMRWRRVLCGCRSAN